MNKITSIYVDNSVCRWHVGKAGFNTTNSINAKTAVYHVPFPYDQGHGEEFEKRIDQSLVCSDRIIVLCSELHDRTVDFVCRYQHPKINFFLCGRIKGIESQDWMDWFITSSHFYKNNFTNVLDRLTPYKVKSKTFDILLGQSRSHRDLIYNFVKENNLDNQVIMTYLNRDNKILPKENTSNWIWEENGLELENNYLQHTVEQVRYYGQNLSLSQVIPIEIYNQTAYSLICETNYSDKFVFHTEKIVKPILSRRLFIVFGGHGYLKNLHRLGFKTFSDIVDESYDNELDYVKRGKMICDQLLHIGKLDQQQVFDSIESIVEHNYNLMMSRDWYREFSREFQSLLLDHAD